MKKKILFALLITLSLNMNLDATSVPIEGDDVNKEKISEIVNRIPQKVLLSFYDSFIIDGNEFKGAFVKDIRNYISFSEIISLIENRGFTFKNTKGIKILDKHKPRGTRGCKYNKNWVCAFQDDIRD